MTLSEQARRNRDFWDSQADEYQRTHGSQLNVDELVWGNWSFPEAEVGALADVAGRDVLELGCGAAQWSIRLARRGARVVGVDNSARQLDHARSLMTAAALDFRLVHASAERVPLPDASFDVVLSDHGAFSWCDPYATVPEAARLLRRGGVLLFNVTSPFVALCWDDPSDRLDTSLHHDYFGLHRVDEDAGAATYHLPYGEWIRLLRRHRLEVEELVELRPPPDSVSTYDGFVDVAWARCWPAENLWKARKG